jgi:hypothetical protein
MELPSRQLSQKYGSDKDVGSIAYDIASRLNNQVRDNQNIWSEKVDTLDLKKSALAKIKPCSLTELMPEIRCG